MISTRCKNGMILKVKKASRHSIRATKDAFSMLDKVGLMSWFSIKQECWSRNSPEWALVWEDRTSSLTSPISTIIFIKIHARKALITSFDNFMLPILATNLRHISICSSLLSNSLMVQWASFLQWTWARQRQPRQDNCRGWRILVCFRTWVFRWKNKWMQDILRPSSYSLILLELEEEHRDQMTSTTITIWTRWGTAESRLLKPKSRRQRSGTRISMAARNRTKVTPKSPTKRFQNKNRIVKRLDSRTRRPRQSWRSQSKLKAR